MEIFKLFGKIAVDNSEANRAIDETVGNVGNAEPRMSKALKKIGAAVVAAFAVDKIKDFGKACISAGMDFDSQMSTVAAISGATGEEFEILRAKAQEMGATTAFSATESAQAMEYMAMAGWKTTDITNGLAGVMNLAAASGEDLATTSDIVTDAMTAFGMSADQSTYFADVLAQTATNANTNVGMMGETFKYVAPLAGAMGYNIEDMSAAIGLMANAGIKGSQSGTSLRNIITNLASPTDKVAGAMDDLGISLTDSDGKTKSFGETLSDLRISFADLDEVQKTQYASAIAGKEGMSGLLALINSSDEDFDKLTDSIKNCTGASEKMAEIRLDNLEGDVTLFKSALEGAQIAISDKLTPVLRNLVKKATDWLPTVQDKLLSAIDVVMDIGKYLVDEFSPLFKDIVEVVGELIPPIMEIGRTALPVVVNLVKKLAPILVDVLKVLTPILNIIPSIIKALSPLIDIIATVAKGVGIATAGFVAFFEQGLGLIPGMVEKTVAEYSKLDEAEQELVDSISELTKEYEAFKESKEKAIADTSNEFDYYQRLSDELQTLADKN